MNSITEVLRLLEGTGSSIEKQQILLDNAEVDGLKPVLKFVFDPYAKAGISVAKLKKATEMANKLKYIQGNEDFTAATLNMIDYLMKNTTGTTADLEEIAEYLCIVNHIEPDAYQYAKDIVTQSLKIGVTSTTLNKVYGSSFIPKVGCMLGTLYGDVKPESVQWPCVVTEKLDGIRRLLIKDNGKCTMYSRSGHIDEGLDDIIREAAMLPDNAVYDGELLAIGDFKDSIALRQATSSIANSGGSKQGLTFNVFDMVPLEEYNSETCETTALNRKILLGATLMDETIQLLEPDNWPKCIAAFGVHTELQYIKSVPILGLINNIAAVTPIVEDIWEAGGEGVMLNTANGHYEIKRSKSLLKIKHTEEHTLTVIDMLEGTGKFENMLGSLIVDYKGNKLGVGSGFNNEQRETIWNNRESYIGKLIEIDTFGESKNAAGEVSLNCPIFKRFVGDVE